MASEIMASDRKTLPAFNFITIRKYMINIEIDAMMIPGR